jgi:hypothetical protein
MARNDPTAAEFKAYLKVVGLKSPRGLVIKARTRLGRAVRKIVIKYNLDPSDQLITNLRLLVQPAGRTTPVFERAFWKKLHDLRIEGNKGTDDDARPRWTPDLADAYVAKVNAALKDLRCY